MDEPEIYLDEKNSLLLIPSAGPISGPIWSREESKRALKEIQDTAARRKARALEKKLFDEKVKTATALSRAIPMPGHMTSKCAQTELNMRDLDLFTVYHTNEKSVKIPTYYQTALSLMMNLKELFSKPECFIGDEFESLRGV